MKTTPFTFVGPERQSNLTDRWRTVLIEGVEYRVGVQQGKRVRIAFKPRGKNVGYEWHGAVYNAGGLCIWSGLVRKSAGVRGILIKAGLIKQEDKS